MKRNDVKNKKATKKLPHWSWGIGLVFSDKDDKLTSISMHDNHPLPPPAEEYYKEQAESLNWQGCKL